MSEKYVVHVQLKKLIKQAGLTVRDVAIVFNIAPFTLANKLNGYSPLDPDLSDRITTVCKRQIAKLEQEAKENQKEIQTISARSKQIKDAKSELVRKRDEAAKAFQYLEQLQGGE